ncbi:hypothetical protein ElyMa_002098200 [Elysia marginata]|uniref:Uncharacterized protein n=1 Tax=Elysia marginata TaxID=1093978 RepID=A0AAV4FEY6_9GAST|nr:hypothetical protein ElyMa_002098200 [Elysia marginata]
MKMMTVANVENIISTGPDYTPCARYNAKSAAKIVLSLNIPKEYHTQRHLDEIFFNILPYTPPEGADSLPRREDKTDKSHHKTA